MSELKILVQKFPLQELAIRRLYASDEDFREACEDYAMAVIGLEEYRKDRAEAAYYSELISDIEAEILRYLDKQICHP